ncbi:MAG TPA: hypothetical protein VK966_04155 [Longimicrobiales bacterium]|nr:hypothetical protein [Longimicrobiales bacterium]
MSSVTERHDVHGHLDIRRDLASAVRRGELPGSLLLYGPPGVGRQTVGRWLARLLVCEAPGDDGPCDQCRACRLALDLQHPDIHWFFPLPRPKGASNPEKLADALEEARHEALAEIRRDSLYRPPPDELTGLYLAQVRTIRRLGSTRPAMGPRQVFIVGDAELLTPQEASEEAANAFLKILEEPPPATTFILTASEPEALLPTLRSRLLPVRLRPLPEEDVAQFIGRVTDAEPARVRLAARLGQGSIGRALGYLPRDGEPNHAEAMRLKARQWLEAALNPKPAGRYAAALAEKPGGARGAFADMLDAMNLWLRDLAAVAEGSEEAVVNVDAVDRLRKLVPHTREDAIPRAIHLVEEAREGGRINANPQLTLAWVLNELHELLSPPTSRTAIAAPHRGR